jgi:hypothetical protein
LRARARVRAREEPEDHGEERGAQRRDDHHGYDGGDATGPL